MVILPKDNFISLFLQLMRALDVARNGRPKITGIWPLGLATGSVSKIIKYIGKTKSPTLIKTSSIIPLGTFMDRSANCNLTFVGFSSPKPNCSYTEYGNKFTLAPKSSNACSIFVSPMMQGIVGHPGSLYLILFWQERIELTFAARKAFLGT